MDKIYSRCMQVLGNSGFQIDNPSREDIVAFTTFLEEYEPSKVTDEKHRQLFDVMVDIIGFGKVDFAMVPEDAKKQIALDIALSPELDKSHEYSKLAEDSVREGFNDFNIKNNKFNADVSEAAKWSEERDKRIKEADDNGKRLNPFEQLGLDPTTGDEIAGLGTREDISVNGVQFTFQKSLKGEPRLIWLVSDPLVDFDDYQHAEMSGIIDIKHHIIGVIGKHMKQRDTMIVDKQATNTRTMGKYEKRIDTLESQKFAMETQYPVDEKMKSIQMKRQFVLEDAGATLQVLSPLLSREYPSPLDTCISQESYCLYE